MSLRTSDPTPQVSLLLLREVAGELGYQPSEEQLRPLSNQIVDQLFRSKPQLLCGTELGKRYRMIAKRVLRKQLR